MGPRSGAGGNALRQAIERWFAAWGHLAYRRAWLVIFAVLAGTGALATQVPNLEIDTSTEGFLRENDPSAWSTRRSAASTAATT